MRLAKMGGFLLVAVVGAFSTGRARAEDFAARLSGFQEVGDLNNETGAILSNGKGTLDVTLNAGASTISYTLTYSDVGTTPPGTGTVTQAHIHLGKVHVPGGIMVFLCSNAGNAPSGTPACPMNGGTVTGTITAGNVLAVPKQNVNAGDFNALVRALESGTAYVNVHSTAYPLGEIRGQVLGLE